MERIQSKAIISDLQKKIVLLSGPRQVGKTWLAKHIATSFKNPLYLNYDRLEDRNIIHKESWLENIDFLILDELHKMDGWKNYLKGVFDTKPEHLQILVTGSARLESFRQSGDSLAGRFFRHRLLPFSPAELDLIGEVNDLSTLIDKGGFPEPFLSADPNDVNRWRMQYTDGLIRNDILDFERIHDFRAIHLLFELLRTRVGSPVSFQSLATDINISPNTVKKYMQILESLFIIFRVTPYSNNIARSILKSPKIYFFDNGLVKSDGARFENFVAICLLKHVYGIEDYEGIPFQLHYLRTKEGQEVDFCLTRDGQPECMIEVKQSDTSLSKNLYRFNQKYQIPGIQLVRHIKREQTIEGIELRRADQYLLELKL